MDGQVMGIFTKTAEILFSIFIQKRFLSLDFIYDSYLKGKDFEDYSSNFLSTR